MTAIRNGLIELFGVRRVDPVEHPRKNRARENYEIISELAERAIIGVPVAYLQRKAPLLFAALMLPILSLTAKASLRGEKLAQWLGKRIIVMQLDAGLLNVARLGQLQLAQSKGNPQQTLLFSIMSIISLVALAFHDLDPGEVPLSGAQRNACQLWRARLGELRAGLRPHQATLAYLNSRRALLTDSRLRHLDEASEILNASLEQVSVLERQYHEILEVGFRSFLESQDSFNESLQRLDADCGRIQRCLEIFDPLERRAVAEAERRRAVELARRIRATAEELRRRDAEEAERRAAEEAERREAAEAERLRRQRVAVEAGSLSFQWSAVVAEHWEIRRQLIRDHLATIEARISNYDQTERGLSQSSQRYLRLAHDSLTDANRNLASLERTLVEGVEEEDLDYEKSARVIVSSLYNTELSCTAVHNCLNDVRYDGPRRPLRYAGGEGGALENRRSAADEENWEGRVHVIRNNLATIEARISSIEGSGLTLTLEMQRRLDSAKNLLASIPDTIVPLERQLADRGEDVIFTANLNVFNSSLRCVEYECIGAHHELDAILQLAMQVPLEEPTVIRGNILEEMEYRDAAQARVRAENARRLRYHREDEEAERRAVEEAERRAAEAERVRRLRAAVEAGNLSFQWSAVVAEHWEIRRQLIRDHLATIEARISNYDQAEGGLSQSSQRYLRLAHDSLASTNRRLASLERTLVEGVEGEDLDYEKSANDIVRSLYNTERSCTAVHNLLDDIRCRNPRRPLRYAGGGEGALENRRSAADEENWEGRVHVIRNNLVTIEARISSIEGSGLTLTLEMQRRLDSAKNLLASIPDTIVPLERQLADRGEDVIFTANLNVFNTSLRCVEYDCWCAHHELDAILQLAMQVPLEEPTVIRGNILEEMERRDADQARVRAEYAGRLMRHREAEEEERRAVEEAERRRAVAEAERRRAAEEAERRRAERRRAERIRAAERAERIRAAERAGRRRVVQEDVRRRAAEEEEGRVSRALEGVTLIPIGKYTGWDLEILRVRLEQMSHSGAKLKYSIMEKRYEAQYNPADRKLTIHTADASQDTASAPFLMVEFDRDNQVNLMEQSGVEATKLSGEHLTALEGAIDAALISKMSVRTSEWGRTRLLVPSSIRVVREGIQRISGSVLRNILPAVVTGNLRSLCANFFNNQLVNEGSVDAGGPRRYLIEQIMAGLSGGMAGEITFDRAGILPEPVAKWRGRFATDPARIPDMELEESKTYEYMGSLMYALYLEDTLVSGHCFSENLFNGVKLFSSGQLRGKFTELSAEERAEITKSYFKAIGEAILEKRMKAIAERRESEASSIPRDAVCDAEELADEQLTGDEKASLPLYYVATAPLDKLHKRDIIAAFQLTDAYMSALLVATSKEDPKIEDLEEKHRWVALCLIDGEVSNIGEAKNIDPAKVREHWAHIQSEIRRDSTREAMALLAPLHAIACGMLRCATFSLIEQYGTPTPDECERIWDNGFCSKPTQEIMGKIQGVLSREKVIEALRFAKEGTNRDGIAFNSDSEPPRQQGGNGSIYRRDCETLKKAKWIREWLADENDCTELYLKKFVAFVAGSSSLPVDKKITISGKRQAQALPNSHTCSFNIEVASSPCGTMDASGRLREDLLNDHTKEAFIRALKTALDNQEFSEW